MLEVMLNCAKEKFDEAESKLLKLIKTVYWSSESVVNGCEALASCGYFERAHKACIEALKFKPHDIDILMYAMRFSLGTGNIEKFDEIYRNNRDLIDRTDNKQVSFTVQGLLKEFAAVKHSLNVSNVSTSDYRKLLRLSENLLQINSVKMKLTNQFLDPNEGDLFINVFVKSDDNEAISEMNDAVIEEMINEFDDLPNGMVQFLPATESLKIQRQSAQ